MPKIYRNALPVTVGDADECSMRVNDTLWKASASARVDDCNSIVAVKLDILRECC